MSRGMKRTVHGRGPLDLAMMIVSWPSYPMWTVNLYGRMVRADKLVPQH